MQEKLETARQALKKAIQAQEAAEGKLPQLEVLRNKAHDLASQLETANRAATEQAAAHSSLQVLVLHS